MTTKALALLLALFLAQLEVTQLSGFGAGGGVITVPFSGTANTNIVLCTYLQGLNYDVTAGSRQVNVELANGAIIGSVATNSATPAVSFETGNCGGTWNTWSVRIIVRSGNSAGIQGHGGYGGAGGLDTACDFWASGGGGAGTAPGGSNTRSDVPNCGFLPLKNAGASGTALAGGAGAIGEATNPGSSPTQTCTNGFPGGTAIQATAGGPNITLEPEAGATLVIWAGGGGGGGVPPLDPTQAGDGGGPGLPGETSGCLGGAAGVKYSQPGAATITEVGPGTINDLGA